MQHLLPLEISTLVSTSFGIVFRFTGIITARLDLLASFFLSPFRSSLSWAIEGNHSPVVEYDFMQPIIGYQCLPSLHACDPCLINRVLRGIALVTAIADIRKWVDFLWHYFPVSSIKVGTSFHFN
jgi:hypothetical protein